MSTERDAADWFARMHGPDADALRPDFAHWYAHRDNAAAYDHLVRTWDQSKFLANTPTGRARNLDLARPAPGDHRRALAIIGGALCAAAIAVAWVGGGFYPGRQTAFPAAVPVAASSGAGRRLLSLADGSRVLLDRASRIEIAFTGAERRLRLLAGRARFDVAHDPGRPFIVEAAGGSVIAHGTLFDVSFEPNGVAILLLRGAIEVRDRGRDPTAPHVRHLLAGQKIMLANGALTAPAVATALDGQWLRPMIEFDATPLGEAVAAFNRTAARPVRIEGLDAQQRRVTGAFRRDDPDGFAATLAATFGLAVRHDAAGIVLGSPRQGPMPKKP